MFQRRLVIYTVLFLLAIFILVTRLVWLQVVNGPAYVLEADQLLVSRPQWLDTVRGSIYDCRKRTLAQDHLGFQLCLHYKLTRLYDPRYWDYEGISYLRRRDNQGKSVLDAELYVQDLLGSQKKRADELIRDLADIIDVPVAALEEAIEEINDRIYILCTSRARYKWYEENGLSQEYESQSNAEGIEADFARRVPDDGERLWLTFKTRVWEMTVAQPVLFNLDQETALKVEDRFVGAFLPGLSRQNRPILVRTGKTRVYPYQDGACHIIGQLGPIPDLVKGYPEDGTPSPGQLEAYYLGDRCGDWGIEYVFERYLRGRRGWIKRDIDGNVIEEIPRIIGSDVDLTIDIELHRSIQEIFEGRNDRQENYRGGAVVIDVVTGQVRAMVSVPTFDLNTYWYKSQYKKIQIEQRDEYWYNRALSIVYQPGSTIKPTMLLGLLESGVITPQTEFDCSVANKTWSGKPDQIHNHGLSDTRRAIKVSCNFYFIMSGLRFGAERMVEWLSRCGFGRAILAWPDVYTGERAERGFSETSGYISPLGRDYPGLYHLRFMSVGLNPLSGSVLQIANSIATIARDGMYLAPTLMIRPGVERYPERICSLESVREVQAGMEAVIYEWGGTGYEAFNPVAWDKDQVKLYGKTGTTDNSLFACYAKASDGRCIALAVVVEVEEDGSDVAAPLAREILKACARHGYIPQPVYDDSE